MLRRSFLAACLALAVSAHAATTTREVVRIAYGDTATLDELGGRFGHLDVDHKNHVARVDVDPEDRAWLEQRGLKVEVDPEATDALARPLAPHVKSIGGYSCFRTVEETHATQDALAAAHPNLARVVDIGDSWEKTRGVAPGYDLRVLRIENFAVPGPKPTLFVMSGIHAREYAPVELTTRFAEWLVNQYAIDSTATWLVDHYSFHLLLEANPDGRKHAEAGALWRKNTNTDYCGATSPQRGADLNRNFPVFWGTVPTGSSPNACDDTYHGPTPASEPEVQAVRDYLAQVFPDTRPGDATDLAQPADPATQGLFFDIHSFARLVLWPWGTSHTLNAPDDAALATLGRRLAAFNGYRPEKSSELYLTDGTTDDFAYGTFGVPAYTMEIGTAFFQDCATFEKTVLPQNLDALKYASRVLAAPYRWPGGPEARNLVATPRLVLPTEPVEVRAVLDDSRFNQSNGLEATQPIGGARVSVDAAPTTAGGGQAMTAVDGRFDTPTETAALTLPAGSLAHGRHLVYVQGTDVSGAAGAPDAVWVEVVDAAQIAAVAGHVRDSVTSAPVAATVRIDGATTTAGADGAFDVRLHPGQRTLVVEAPGYLKEQATFDFAGGSVQQREVALTPECRLFGDDAEGVDPGWTAASPWSVVTVAGPDGQPTKAWTDDPSGPYRNNLDRALMSPRLDFSGVDGVRLHLDQLCDTEAGYDFGRIEVSTDGGASWTEISRCSGDPQWRRLDLDVPALDGASNARIRFRLTTDPSETADGWTIDNIALAGAGNACRASRASLATAQHGLSGTWYEAATAGQGFTFEVFPSANLLAGGWFTYASGTPGGDARQRWVSLSGPVSTAPGATELTLYRNVGGNFDAAPVTSATAVGSATLQFDSCTSAQLSYRFTDGSGLAGTIPLTRLTSNVECGASAANADFGLSGNWYDPATSGQGFIVEINPATPIVFATWYTYASNGAAGVDGQRWYTLQSSNARAGARRFDDLVIYQTTGGSFDAAPGASQVTQAVGTATLTFDSCAAAHVSYAFTSGTNAGRTGTINLQRAGAAPASCRF